MSLSPKQRAFLAVLEEGPVFVSDRRCPGWSTEEKLWLAGFIDQFGRSIYITDAGRRAIDPVENQNNGEKSAP